MKPDQEISAPVPCGASVLPEPRGPVSDQIFEALRSAPRDLHWTSDVHSASEEDFQLSLYCCYELHYKGFADVHTDWEWQPSLLRIRLELEERLESNLRNLVGPIVTHPEVTIGQLWDIAQTDSGPSLSSWVLAHGTLEHLRELAKHRSAYQLKEADPHTWAIPRLSGAAKAVMVAIQADEYGNGSSEMMHASLFSETMTALGLETTPNFYLDELPASTILTTNIISYFALHRRLRGALVGHLAMFEMTSTGPMSRYAQTFRRLGLPRRARQFYDVHVEADRHHQHMAADGMVAGLLAEEPYLAEDVIFGARALSLVESRFTEHLLSCWQAGRTSLRSDTRPSSERLHASQAVLLG